MSFEAHMTFIWTFFQLQYVPLKVLPLLTKLILYSRSKKLVTILGLAFLHCCHPLIGLEHGAAQAHPIRGNTLDPKLLPFLCSWNKCSALHSAVLDTPHPSRAIAWILKMSYTNEHLWPLSMVQIKAFLGVSTFLVGKFWSYSHIKLANFKTCVWTCNMCHIESEHPRL